MIDQQFYLSPDEIEMERLLDEIEMAELICSLLNSVETFIKLTPDSEFWPDREFHRVLLDETLYPDNAIMRLALDMRHNG